jgi:hypothetical protein
MDREAKLAEIESLQARLGQLEAEVHDLAAGEVWTPPKYYTAYEMMGGMVLGLIAAGASLLFNVIGGLMFGKHALELIRVYLTFPMGEPALELENGFALAAGGVPVSDDRHDWGDPNSHDPQPVLQTVQRDGPVRGRDGAGDRGVAGQFLWVSVLGPAPAHRRAALYRGQHSDLRGHCDASDFRLGHVGLASLGTVRAVCGPAGAVGKRAAVGKSVGPDPRWQCVLNSRQSYGGG